MAKFSAKNLEWRDNQKAIFGNDDDSEIYWDGTQLVVTTTASGVDPIEPGHLVTKRYFENYAWSTVSGIPYVDADDVYFYDSTRGKDLGITVLQIGCGRNSANTTNQYLRTFDGTPMNQAGVALPWPTTFIGSSIVGAENNQSWTIYIRKNGSATNIASLSITNSYENHDMSANVDFNEGDRVQIYLQGTNISYPQARVYFRRRK